MHARKGPAVVLALGLMAGACSSGDEAAIENTVAVTDSSASSSSSTTTIPVASTTSTTTTTTVPEPTDEEQIQAVLEGYWRTVLVDSWKQPGEAIWLRFATPELATTMSGRIQRSLESGQAIRGLEPDVDFVLASDAVVVDRRAVAFMCLRDDGETYEPESGEVVASSNIITLKRVELIQGGPGWRVAASESLARFEAGEVEACIGAFP